MTTSGTYAFNPGIADLILNAFSRCGIRGPAITDQHLADAAMECNLLNVQFTNRTPVQWQLETPTVALSQGQALYALPNRTVAIGVIYMTTGTDGSAFDRPLVPMSASEYGAIPNKATQGPPTMHWVQLLPVPQLTVWPVPDGGGPYKLNIQSFRQQQDLAVAGGQTLDAPYRFLDAFVAGLAARLARNWAPAAYAARKADWEEAWQEATQRDQEDASLYITPGLSSYFL